MCIADLWKESGTGRIFRSNGAASNGYQLLSGCYITIAEGKEDHRQSLS